MKTLLLFAVSGFALFACTSKPVPDFYEQIAAANMPYDSVFAAKLAAEVMLLGYAILWSVQT